MSSVDWDSDAADTSRNQRLDVADSFGHRLENEGSLVRAMHIHGRDRKRTVEWSENFSPVAPRKCKRVGRSPTDAPLPDW